jgi:hypothetical protein
LIKRRDALKFPPQTFANKTMNTRLLILLSLSFVLPVRGFAATDPFVGNWNLKPDRSRFFGVQEKIEDLGGYKYKFTTGDRVETIVLDGEDHPSTDGGTWALRKIGPNKWKSIDKMNDQVTAVSIWTVSDDGQTFTSVTTGIKSDGSRYKTEFTAKRTSGTSGLIGTWVGAGPSEHVPTRWSIQPYQGGGLSLISRDNLRRVDVKFDGKDYPDTGRNAPPGSTISATRIDQLTIELVGKVNGKPTYLERLQVSADGQTLALGIGAGSAALSAVYYYRRQ